MVKVGKKNVRMINSYEKDIHIILDGGISAYAWLGLYLTSAHCSSDACTNGDLDPVFRGHAPACPSNQHHCPKQDTHSFQNSHHYQHHHPDSHKYTLPG